MQPEDGQQRHVHGARSGAVRLEGAARLARPLTAPHAAQPGLEGDVLGQHTDGFAPAARTWKGLWAAAREQAKRAGTVWGKRQVQLPGRREAALPLPAPRSPKYVPLLSVRSSCDWSKQRVQVCRGGRARVSMERERQHRLVACMAGPAAWPAVPDRSQPQVHPGLLGAVLR